MITGSPENDYQRHLQIQEEREEDDYPVFNPCREKRLLKHIEIMEKKRERLQTKNEDYDRN